MTHGVKHDPGIAYLLRALGRLEDPRTFFVGAVINRLQEINSLLTTNPGQALGQMLTLLAYVGPKTRKTAQYIDLKAKLVEAIQMRASIYSPLEMTLIQKITDFDRGNAFVYLGYYDIIWAIMWDAGYLSEEMFAKFHDPSKGRKSGRP